MPFLHPPTTQPKTIARKPTTPSKTQAEPSRLPLFTDNHYLTTATHHCFCCSNAAQPRCSSADHHSHYHMFVLFSPILSIHDISKLKFITPYFPPFCLAFHIPLWFHMPSCALCSFLLWSIECLNNILPFFNNIVKPLFTNKIRKHLFCDIKWVYFIILSTELTNSRTWLGATWHEPKNIWLDDSLKFCYIDSVLKLISLIIFTILNFSTSKKYIYSVSDLLKTIFNNSLHCTLIPINRKWKKKKLTFHPVSKSI